MSVELFSVLLQDKGIYVFTQLGVRDEAYQSLGASGATHACKL